MLDLDKEPELPKYEFVYGGETRRVKVLETSWQLKDVEGEQDPGVIAATVNKVLKVELDEYKACLLLKDFFEFMKSDPVAGPLKNVFGQGLFSATTLASTP